MQTLAHIPAPSPHTGDITADARATFVELHRLLADLRDRRHDTARVNEWLDNALYLARAVAAGATVNINPDLQDVRCFNQWIAWNAADVCKLLPETTPEIDQKLARLRAYPTPKQPIAAYTPKYYFTFDVFTNRIPGFEPLLRSFAGAPDIHFLEIGSFEGMSACWFIDHILTHPASTMTCIDEFYADLFEENITKTGQRHRVTKRTGKSVKVLPTMASNHYDFIYVDGDHDKDVVFKDADLAWLLLKRGGIMLCDDYGYEADFMAADPRAGVDAFLAAKAGQYRVILEAYQLAIVKL
jgi:hypothetical protein